MIHRPHGIEVDHPLVDLIAQHQHIVALHQAGNRFQLALRKYLTHGILGRIPE